MGAGARACTYKAVIFNNLNDLLKPAVFMAEYCLNQFVGKKLHHVSKPGIFCRNAMRFRFRMLLILPHLLVDDRGVYCQLYEKSVSLNNSYGLF